MASTSKADKDALRRISHARYVATHRETLRERDRRYRREHPDRVKVTRARYRQKHAREIQEYSKAYYGRTRTRQRAYAAANRGRENARRQIYVVQLRDWYVAHKLGIPRKDCRQELIQAKRAILMVKRVIRDGR